MGFDGVDKRIDVLATALRAGLTVFDLEHLELAYAPHFGSAKDPVNMAGFLRANLLRGDHQLWCTPKTTPKRSARAPWWMYVPRRNSQLLPHGLFHWPGQLPLCGPCRRPGGRANAGGGVGRPPIPIPFESAQNRDTVSLMCRSHR
ncbi:MAG: hypothetical protein HC922_06565 [Leptolyngbyaceae cyanobacterium SM2_3_12]|nr:hypothetical protein [Leptolyngbyaceae cyanobacterium SM2_3_12]